jgi:hypothetical protein
MSLHRSVSCNLKMPEHDDGSYGVIQLNRRVENVLKTPHIVRLRCHAKLIALPSFCLVFHSGAQEKVTEIYATRIKTPRARFAAQHE